MDCHGCTLPLNHPTSGLRFMIFRHLTGFMRKHGRISEGPLDRSPSTYLREINSHVVHGRPLRNGVDNTVVTLDPNKFAEKKQRPFHIGNRQYFIPYTIMLQNQSGPISCLLFYDYRHSSRLASPSYPPDTTAFLYYFTSPEKPRIAGELRLRVTSSDDHTSFESGSDLLKLNGQPWSRSLFRVSKFFTPLYEKLREEGLVPDDLDAVLSTFSPIARRCQHLYKLNDPFIVDFSVKELYFVVITEQGMSTRQYNRPFSQEPHKSSIRIAPYTGSALVRFERSTLPDHEGTRTVVLRFLKIITSVKCVIPNYNGYIVQPKEGELHRKCITNKTIDKLNPPVWSVDIDKSVTLRGLQLLWDT